MRRCDLNANSVAIALTHNSGGCNKLYAHCYFLGSAGKSDCVKVIIEYNESNAPYRNMIYDLQSYIVYASYLEYVTGIKVFAQ